MNEEHSMNILYWSITDQTHFGMPRVANINLDLNELKLVAIHSNSSTNSKHAPKSRKRVLILHAKQGMENRRGPISDEKTHCL